MMEQSEETGRKPLILIVEDEFLIADMLQGMLEDLGCQAVGPCNTLAEGLQCAREMDFDAAFVDLILHEKPAYEVGRILQNRGLPFSFATGLSDQALAEEWKEHPFLLHKPYAKEEVARLLRAMLGAEDNGVPSERHTI